PRIRIWQLRADRAAQSLRRAVVSRRDARPAPAARACGRSAGRSAGDLSDRSLTMLFRDRVDAGRKLAEKLASYRNQPGVIVLALPRGGVPVGFEVAQALGAPLDVFLVRKLGVPGHEELAMGAIATGGVRVMNDQVLQILPITSQVVDRVTGEEQQELERRERLYRNGRPAPDVRGSIVILVDDGLATGSTMRAAVTALRQLGPKRIGVAVPGGSPGTCAQ